jgi:Methyltransferase small domain
VTFNGLSLASRPGRVMTPRRATEPLVRAALDRIGSDPARVVDVGTGVGAIAVAIADAAPNAHVFATDTSRCAIALARANVRRHGLCDRVTVRHGRLLEPVPGEIDLVVANLPTSRPPTPNATPIWPVSLPPPSSPRETGSTPTGACSPPAQSGWTTRQRLSSNSTGACSKLRAPSYRSSAPGSSARYGAATRTESWPPRRPCQPAQDAKPPTIAPYTTWPRTVTSGVCRP